MGKEFMRQILLFAENNAGINFDHDESEILAEFDNVEYDVLDDHLIFARDGGLIEATRTIGGWFIDALTLAGQKELESSASIELLVEAIREASEREESVAREDNEIAKQSAQANDIATGANTQQSLSMLVNIVCAAISSGSVIAILVFWFSRAN